MTKAETVLKTLGVESLEALGAYNIEQDSNGQSLTMGIRAETSYYNEIKIYSAEDSETYHIKFVNTDNKKITAYEIHIDDIVRTIEIMLGIVIRL